MIHARNPIREELSLAIGIAASVVAVLLFIPFLPSMPSATLDASWMMAINQALAHHLVFGKDLIFTSGPLGPLYTTEYAPETNNIATWGSGFIAAALCGSYLLVARPSIRWMLVALPLAIAVAVLRDGPCLALPLIYLLLAFRLTRPRTSDLALGWTLWRTAACVLISIALWMLPLVKGSFAGAVYGVSALTIVLLWRAGYRSMAVMQPLIGVVTLCVAWIAVGQPIDALPHFFLAQKPIIAAYGNAMSLIGSRLALLYWLIATSLALALGYLTIGRRYGLDGLLCMLGLAGCLFISFKAGFVREDGHIWASSSFLVFVALGLAVMSNYAIGLVAISIAILNVMLVDSTIEPVGPRVLVERVEQAVDRTWDGIRLRYRGQLPVLYEDALATIRRDKPLPAVDGTADLYSTDLAVLFANHLHWTPRHALQSYSAYEPSLDRADADSLLSASAPNTVFFALEPIDGRLPALEDALSWPILMTRYSIVGVNGDYLRLQRNSHPRSYVANGAAAHEEVTFGEPAQVPDAPFVQASIDIEPSFIGRILGVLFKMPQVSIELTLSDGRVIDHRLIPSMAHNFMLSPYINGTESWELTMLGLNAERVREIRIITAHRHAYRPNIRISFIGMRMQPQSLLSSGLSATPSMGLSSIIDPERTADCAIDALNNTPPQKQVQVVANGALSVRGWVAPNAASGIGPVKAWVELTSAINQHIYFPVTPTDRPDVAQFFKQPEMRRTGISTLADISGLHGEYTLRLLASDGKKISRCAQSERIVVP